MSDALPHLLDVAQLAEHLGVTVRHVRRLVAERRIPYKKWGHLIRFDPDEVAEWIEASTVPCRPLPTRYVPTERHMRGVR